MKNCLSLLFVCMMLFAPTMVIAKKHVVRLATLAPKGSSWVNLLEKMGRDIRKKSEGKLKIKFYTGGSMGDEKIVVRKMRLGSLQGAVLTSIGLAQIDPSVLALQLPFLFKNYKELDYVRAELDEHLRSKFEKKGFVFLGWGDLGYVYLYSRQELKSVSDLRKAKIWGWTDDPLTRRYTKDAGVTPHLLSLLDVRSALQTGAVDTVIGTPLSVIAMQWHSYLKYRVQARFAIGIGATVMTKKAFDLLSPELQKTLLDVSGSYHKKLVKTIRTENRKAKIALKKRGLKGIKLSKEKKEEIREVARKTRASFAGTGKGKLFPQEDLDKIVALLKKYRSLKEKK